MDSEREEVYERIPWETLERKSGDRQWMVYAVAGAVTVGALAYSFTRNQPANPVATTVPAVTSVAEEPLAAVPAAPAPTVPNPVVAEADLFAVDPERVVDQVAAHAEWFAVEYVAVDGSERSRETLASLLPEGVPTPKAPEGTQVFVDWARATRVTQVGTLDYQVEVLLRSLVSSGDSAFARQPPRLLVIEVELTDDGVPRVSGVPMVGDPATTESAELAMTALPEDVAAALDPSQGEVLGGVQADDGSWQAIVMAPGLDGITRPVIVQP